MGAALHGSGFPTAVLASRVIIISVTVVFLVRAFPAAELLSALTAAMLVLAGFASLTGIGSLAGGRLYGGLPPLNANEISLLISVPLVCIMWRVVHRVANGRDVALILPALGVIWLTGTRTGLAMLALAVVVLILMAPRIPVPLFCCGVLAVPMLLTVTFFTPLLSSYATRGDTASVLTLNSRTVAWNAALSYSETLPEQVLGVGLAVKQDPGLRHVSHRPDPRQHLGLRLRPGRDRGHRAARHPGPASRWRARQRRTRRRDRSRWLC